MSADDGPVANREVAWRLFAEEFRDADFEFSEADEERAPNYVITPTGARVNRLFVVGVLTEVEQVGEDILRARVVDPTGAFVVYAGQYQPDAKAFLQGVNPPAFVAVTGKARTFQPDDSDVVYTSIRPESINVVDADTRDRWAVQTARHTLHRVSTFDDALDEVGDALEEALLARGVEPGLAAGIALAREHYGTTRGYLAAVHDLAIDAARVVAGEIDADEVNSLSLAPDEGGEDVSVDLTYTLPEAVDSELVEEPSAATEPATTGATDASAGTTAETTPNETESIEEETGEAETASEAEEPPEVPDAEASAERGVPTDEEPDVQPEQETTPDEAFEPEIDDEAEVGTDESGSEMYELDEEERQELEENYPTEFSSGAEVGEPGEADIEPAGANEASEVTGDVESTGPTAEEVEPEPAEEPAVEDEGEDLDEIAEDVEADEEAPTEEPVEDEEPAGDEGTTEGGEATDEAEPAEEAPENLDDALIDVMADLNEGDGVSRADLEAEMADRYGASPEEVGDAIDDALMGGQCYESGDDTYMPI